MVRYGMKDVCDRFEIGRRELLNVLLLNPGLEPIERLGRARMFTQDEFNRLRRHLLQMGVAELRSPEGN